MHFFEMRSSPNQQTDPTLPTGASKQLSNFQTTHELILTDRGSQRIANSQTTGSRYGTATANPLISSLLKTKCLKLSGHHTLMLSPLWKTANDVNKSRSGRYSKTIWKRSTSSPAMVSVSLSHRMAYCCPSRVSRRFRLSISRMEVYLHIRISEFAEPYRNTRGRQIGVTLQLLSMKTLKSGTLRKENFFTYLAVKRMVDSFLKAMKLLLTARANGRSGISNHLSAFV